MEGGGNSAPGVGDNKEKIFETLIRDGAEMQTIHGIVEGEKKTEMELN